MFVDVLDANFRGVMSSEYLMSELSTWYRTAKPFPHVILNEVIRPPILHAMESEFPLPGPAWWKYDNALERKFAKDDLSDVSESIQRTIACLQSRVFTEFLEKLTGIEGLISDQMLRGGGLHQITRGGKLDIHADHNLSPRTGLDRRLNVLLYLNSGWKDEWKGHLELWNKDMTQCQDRIKPSIGTMVIFSTTDDAFHGHPDPLECPEGVTRKSIALYYWTNGRPEHEKSDPHSTIYKARPQDSKDEKLEQLRQARAKGRILQ